METKKIENFQGAKKFKKNFLPRKTNGFPCAKTKKSKAFLVQKNKKFFLESKDFFSISKEEKVSQEQLYDMLISKEVSWQAILLDLIKTEQLDPWDIDLSLLVQKYLEKIYELEELNFFISSKVLLAAALLLRIKSELLYSSMRDIDEILFGNKEEEKEKEKEIIDIDESEIPLIIPRSPLPRSRKVSLNELMTALNKAMKTEHRRIKRELLVKKRFEEAQLVLPRASYIDIRIKIKEIYLKVKTFFFKNKDIGMTYTDLVGTSKEERISCFLPILQLSNTQKIDLQQENHFEEIFIWLKSIKKPKLQEDSHNPEILKNE